MSAAGDNNRASLAGLTLDAVLGGTKTVPPMPADTPATSQAAPPAQAGGRTLLDVIRDEPPHKGQKDKKSWKTFRERLRLKRTGSAWTSSVHTPTSDIIQPRPAYRTSRGPHVRFVTPESARDNSANDDDDVEVETVPVSDPPTQQQRPPMFARRSSTRVASYQVDNNDGDDDSPAGSRMLGSALAEDRALSAREAAAAQEAAEAADETDSDDDEEGGGAGGDGDGGGGGAPMSLMDLLGESGYAMGEDDDEEDEEDEEDEKAVEEDEDDGGGGVEHTCCVCMVRHKGAAFIPCGHTFCRLCSRELLVQRGQCPLCNGFILEILDIF